MATQNITFTVNIQGGGASGQATAQVQQLTQATTQASTATQALGASTQSLTSRVSSNGGAMALLNTLTGGYAQVAKDAIEATGLFGSSLTVASVKAKLFGTAARSAMTATGIGILVVAIGLLITYWDDLTDAVGLTNTALERTIELNDRLIIGTSVRQVKAEEELKQAKLRAEQNKKDGKLTIGSIASILTAEIKLQKAKEEAFKAAKKDLQLEILGLKEGSIERAKVVAQLSKLQNAYETQAAITENTVQKQRDAYNNYGKEVEEVAEVIVKSNEKIKDTTLDRLEFETSLLEEGIAKELEENENARLRAVAQATLLGVSIEDVNKSFALRAKEIREGENAEVVEEEEKLTKDLKVELTTRQKQEKAFQDAKADIILGSASQIASAFESLAGENEDAAKGFAVTSVLIDTAVAIMKAFAQLGPIGGAVAAAGIGATSLAAIAKITSAGDGGTSNSSVGPTGVLTNATQPAPNFFVPTSQESQLAAAVGAGSNGNQVFKTYVTTQDIATAQELERQSNDYSRTK